MLYTLSDYIGEEKFNAALSKYINQFAFQEPPYTTSIQFVDHLEKNTPDSLQYLIDDMLKNITLYDNYIHDADYKMNADSTYTVNIDAVVSKYRSTPKGKKLFARNNDSLIHIVNNDTLKSWPLNDYVEVGIFTESKEDNSVRQKPLYIKKVKFDSIFHSFDIQVDQKPVEVGIDPFNKLIDTHSNDNRKTL